METGRLVNITIYNFPPELAGQTLAHSSACYEVGTITEGSVSQTIHKCLTDPRQKVLYVSQGGPVDLKFTHADVSGRFLISYQGIRANIYKAIAKHRYTSLLL